MSIRLRLFAFVATVALVAIGATAYLSYRQTSRQANAKVRTDRVELMTMLLQIEAYGQKQGTWDGLAERASSVAAQFDQHLRVRTASGTVLVDTGGDEGGTPEYSVDPAPSREVAAAFTTDPKSTVQAIGTYRRNQRLAACLTRARAPFATHVASGIPTVVTLDTSTERAQAALADHLTDVNPQSIEAYTRCRQVAAADPIAAEHDREAVAGCHAESGCLYETFLTRTADVRPERVTVLVSAAQHETLGAAPVVVAAAAVATLTLGGALLLSRRILRPVDSLTQAARRLGDGDLSRRVPESGGDEFSELAAAFNQMADSLQRSEESQRRLIADVAHELRSPLANLRGYLEALKDNVVPPTPDLFASLHEEAILQQRIIDDLQDLALADAGQLRYHRTRVDAAELLDTSRSAHQATADAVDVRLVVDAPRPVIIDADADRIRQVIGNLVGNALRATPAGGVVTLTATESEGSALITVRDTGTGINAEDLPYIFDRFWRADAARTRNGGGSGLGLAIARQIVTDHTGHLTATSTANGTVMTIELPSGAVQS